MTESVAPNSSAARAQAVLSVADTLGPAGHASMGILRTIWLRDFRNYPQLTLTLAPGVNLFVGENGQGKTNLLEAVHFLSILRSFRTHQPQHLRRWQSAGFMIRGTLEEADGRAVSLAVGHGVTRALRIDGQPVSRASDYLGQLLTVPFIPDDVELISGSGSARRRFLDILLCQLRPGYLNCLQEYQKALRSRNQLLKRERLAQRTLVAFDGVLADRGGRLLADRAALFDEIKPFLAATVAAMWEGDGPTVELHYRPSVDFRSASAAPAVALAAALAAGFAADQQRRHTQTGPHRDDFGVLLNGRQLAAYGSAGQCRIAALVLKFASARMLAAANERDDVVWLVDDVIGELDRIRRQAFCRALNASPQALVACTDESGVAGLEPQAVFRVRDGAITAA